MFSSLVGRPRAAALVLTGEPVSGAQAAAWGLVWRAVPAASLDTELAAVATAFRAKSAASLRLAKRTMRAAADAGSLRGAITAADAEQRTGLPRIADADEGLRAFLEKRPPRWQHR
jgi:enoyl-CoA hydratase/carnithine racemase